MIDNSLGNGVYYAKNDYAGFLRRLTAMVIDSVVLLIIGVCLAFVALVVELSFQPNVNPAGIAMIAWLGIAWIYLVVLKRSRFRTLAYLLLDLKIVTTKGQHPSLFAMTFRMLLWMLGPFNFILDLMWLGADSEHQSLRDCYAGTYVVRSSAEPLGTAPMHLARFHAMGFAIAYPRVVRPAAKPAK